MLLNITPKQMQNGDVVSYYKDTVDTSGQTFTFPTSQERVKVQNLGAAPITYTIGSKTGSLGPSETVDVIETITQFTLTASSKTQAFEVWSDELGSNQSGVDLSSINAQLAQNATRVYDNANLIKSIQIPNTISGAVCGWVDDNTPKTFITSLKTLCDKYNFTVGMACVTSLTGDSTHMTLQDMLNMQNLGHEIYSHSVTHDPNLWYTGNLINTAPSVLINELQQSQQYLKDNGFTTWDTFIYPGGAYSYDEWNKIKPLTKKFYRYGIDSANGASPFPIDNMRVNRLSCDAGKNFATDIQPVIDSALASKSLLIIMTHSGGAMYDAALTEQVIQYIQSKGVSIMPARQALEIKGNALAIGDPKANTSNKFFLSKDGNITLPVKFLDGESPVSNSLDFTSPLTAFPFYCESRMFCRAATDTLTNEGGILSTFYSWVGSYYNKQEFVSSVTFKKYIRSWNESTSTWNAWQSTTVSPQVVFNALDSIPITTAGNTTYASNTIQVTPYSDSYATANSLPTGGAGICTTQRFSSGTTIQEYRPNYGGSADEVYVRHYYSSAWSPWIRRGGGQGNTASRPATPIIGYMYFDTTLNKPIWYKGSSTWVDATGATV